MARGLQIDATELSFKSTNAGRKAGFLRQLQDRVQQANIAGYEIKNIDKQILTQKIRINIANQEITNQQKQIDNAQEVEEFLRNKYTNQELYSWMEDSIRALYHQAYTLAYDLAKKAEKVYRFERGLSDSNSIQYGYWDAAHDGLLSGERMYIGLKQLEAAYMEKRGYDYEFPKTFSLRELNPMALLHLRDTGSCEFSITEARLDMDRPGEHKRRIKSLALTIPSVVGPYTSLNCTLRLLEHSFRVSPIVGDSYAPKTDDDEPDDRFSTVNVPITAIAVSSGQNDSGVFELNFRDERYLPFEGAGAVSKWRLELPQTFLPINYKTITDVLVQLRITSVEGGARLATAASKAAQDYFASTDDLKQDEGLFAAFDLKHDFPSEWSRLINPPANTTDRVMDLGDLTERLPYFTRNYKVQSAEKYLVYPKAANLPVPSLVKGQGQNSEDHPFGSQQGPDFGKDLKSFVNDEGLDLGDWRLEFSSPLPSDVSELWLVMRYTMTKPAGAG